MHVVAKPFNTVQRRFAEGQTVTEADIDGPAPFERWVELGFIAEDTPAPTRRPRMPAFTEPAPGPVDEALPETREGDTAST